MINACLSSEWEMNLCVTRKNHAYEHILVTVVLKKKENLILKTKLIPDKLSDWLYSESRFTEDGEKYTTKPLDCCTIWSVDFPYVVSSKELR